MAALRFRKKWTLAATPCQREAEEAKRLIGQARERLSATMRGREMLAFADDAQYKMDIRALAGNTLALCDPNAKRISFNQDCDADTITATMPHEIFHGMQFDSCERLMNFQRFFLGGANAAFQDVPRERFVRIMEPCDLSHSTNVIEMAAYAVQTAMVMELFEQAGDTGVKAAFDRTNPGFTASYQRVTGHDVFYCGIAANRAVTAPSRGDFCERYDRHKLAASLSAYKWFWGALSGENDNSPQRHRYADQKIEFLDKAVEGKTARYFTMRAEGYEFDFGFFGGEDIRTVGQGFGFDIFGIPEFENVDSEIYRAEITAENRDKLSRICSALDI